MDTKTYEELKREFFPLSGQYDRLAASGDSKRIYEAVHYYRNEVEKTLEELGRYFKISANEIINYRIAA